MGAYVLSKEREKDRKRQECDADGRSSHPLKREEREAKDPAFDW